jgi:mycothiol synthase
MFGRALKPANPRRACLEADGDVYNPTAMSVHHEPTEHTEQLRMSFPASGERPAVQVKLPEGYLIRGCLPGDEDAWIELIGLCGFDGWDQGRFDEYMDKPERKDGSRLVLLDDRIVAATFAGRGDVEANVGRVDYVVSHPSLRGRGLGKAVCAGVLDYLLGRGYETVELFTDDWRLPAIGLYLSLGLTPDMTSAGMHPRWETVMERLGSNHPR